MAFVISGSQNSNHKQGPNIPRSYPPRKNRPFCTHCNIHGHIIEKCYKIHGYPPGYNKPRNTTSTPASANQVQCSETPATINGESTTFLPQLNAVQYQQLLNLLASQYSGIAPSNSTTSDDNPGTSNQEGDWQG
ncbi:uncharacterized protein LOC133815744 [Humulus lupulus]|uniref:uncharacterized protein LOC133815744 n=1 Tax=Humulus lupulus TaxID=3486 RepID=UPI002B415DBA|nr:uncharacterized protein LOC133815744 [Humulus lupulus]